MTIKATYLRLPINNIPIAMNGVNEFSTALNFMHFAFGSIKNPQFALIQTTERSAKRFLYLKTLHQNPFSEIFIATFPAHLHENQDK